MFRLYSPTEGLFDGTWALPDAADLTVIAEASMTRVYSRAFPVGAKRRPQRGLNEHVC